jgi:pyrroloquinoline quinone (PQQ) biosynthesis protein C
MTIELRDFQLSSSGIASRDRRHDDDAEQYLDDQLKWILAHRGVDHPFLNDYAERGLSAEAERLLYLETHYYFVHVPFYICSICTLTRDENVLREVIRNVRDELGDSVSHADLFRDFLGQIGISPADVSAYRPLASTQALNLGTLELYTKSSITKALGSFYAEETQSAAMVAKYHAGLRASGHAGKAAVLSFWELHMEAEFGHSNSVYRCVEPYIRTAEGRAEFNTGIDAYMQLLEAYWDGLDKLISPITRRSAASA